MSVRQEDTLWIFFRAARVTDFQDTPLDNTMQMVHITKQRAERADLHTLPGIGRVLMAGIPVA